MSEQFVATPFYELNAPGMPLPGPDFVAHALAMGDPEPEYDGKGRNTKLESYGPILRDLYFQALYAPGSFYLPVRTKFGWRDSYVVPGHVWSGDATGPRPSRVMVIGKHPGREEQERQRNFCGPTSQFFHDAVRGFGVDPSDWYVTNVCRFMPPDGSGTVSAAWIKDCLPLLHQELRLVRPQFVLCLGSDAVKTVLGKQASVSGATGVVHEMSVPLGNGEQHHFKVFVCRHPAEVYRDDKHYPTFQRSLRGFVNLLNGRTEAMAESDIDHRVIWDEEELSNLVDELLADPTSHVLAFDAEWHGERPSEPGAYIRTIQFSWKAKHAALLALRGTGGVSTFEGNAARQVNRLLARPGTRVVGHFFRSDTPWLLHEGIDIRKQFEAPLDDPPGPGRRFGWEKTATEGGFDIGLAAHACTETGPFGLEMLTMLHTPIHRYDLPLDTWKHQYCKDHGMKVTHLEGYGECPDNILHPYGLYDADTTRRLFDHYNGTEAKPGALDFDNYGNCCREAFWVSSRAIPAVLEIETTGLCLDKDRAVEMTGIYKKALAERVEQIREWANWPKFNPNSAYQCREFLFGEAYSGKIDKATGEMVSVRPDGARSLMATPIKTTGKRPKPWGEALRYNDGNPPVPSTDKETLGILASEHEKASWLRDIRFIGQMLKSVLKPPVPEEPKKGEIVLTATAAADEDWIIDGHEFYDGGLLKFVQRDGRIHTHILQTLETGRCSSSRPPLQNLGKRREADYKRILGENYKYALRSVIVAADDHYLVEADYLGAELAGMAWMSGDSVMSEHVRRTSLPEDHPDFYDIHSNVSVSAFRLLVNDKIELDKKTGQPKVNGRPANLVLKLPVGAPCPPTKQALGVCQYSHLRVAAKAIAFGLAYGRGAKAIQRALAEEDVVISLDETKQLIEAFLGQYPMLEPFFEACKSRVVNPGWLCNSFGRFRRFRAPDDEGMLSELERQAMNFPIQSLVADAMWRALDHLYCSEEHRCGMFRIVLQIHDAVLLEVPKQFVRIVTQETLPRCMSRMVPIYPSRLDGTPIGTGPYNLGIDVSVGRRWGEEFGKKELAELLAA